MRVAVLGAGGPAGVNALKALTQAGHECVAVDDNAAHLTWCEQYAETYASGEEFHADVVLPQPDPLVRAFADLPSKSATLLPRLETIVLCQDKLKAQERWFNAKLRTHPPVEIREPLPDHLHLARDRFGLPFWLRARKGAGAKGAILVRQLNEAFHWMRFWQERQDIEWVAEEYLPGRDFAWSGIFYDGELVTSFARERVEYLYPHLTPEGLTGTPTIARITHEEDVNEMALAAVLAVDLRPHGIFSVDLREDADGYPRPTEINAGRGFTTFGLWSLYSHNFLDIVVRLARDGRSWWLSRPDLAEPPRWNALPDGLTLYRHIDCGHMFVPARKPALTLCR